MNPLHYPSLELCKKLTESGFPSTPLSMVNYKGGWDIMQEYYITTSEAKYITENYVCPSVMELLDNMPNDSVKIIKFAKSYRVKWSDIKTTTDGTLPNALAKMCLWLKENNYLPI